MTAELPLRAVLPRPQLGVPGPGEAVVAGLVDGVRSMLDDFAVPGEPALRLDGAPAGELPLLGLEVDGRWLWASADALDRSLASATGGWLPRRATGPDAFERLVGLPGPLQRSAARQLARDLIGRAPQVLLGERQAAALADAIGTAEVARVAGAARALLRCRTSLAERGPLAEACTGHPREAVERVVAQQNLRQVTVLVEPALLRSVTLTATESDRRTLELQRETVLRDLGVAVPAIRVVPDAGLPVGCVAYRVNDLVTGPLRIPLPGEAVTLAEIDENRPGVVPITAPFGGWSATVAPVEAADGDPPGGGWWTPWQYVGLGLRAEIHRHAVALVDTTVVRERLDALDEYRPYLVRGLRARFPDWELAGLLRDLVADRISIENWRAVALAALEAGAELEPAVRRGLAYTAVNRLGGGAGTAVVYLLDADLQERLARVDGDAGASPAGMELLEAFTRELAFLPPHARVPALLVGEGCREAAARSIGAAYPDVPVVSYDELPPRMAVQPVARVGAA